MIVKWLFTITVCVSLQFYCTGQSRYIEPTDSAFAVGDIIRLRHPIRFIICNDWEKRVVDDSSHLVLDEVVVFLNNHPKVRIEIGSHTDSRGTVEANLKLSQSRSESIRKLLIDKGVDSLRINAVGYGESQPLTVYYSDSTYLIDQPEFIDCKPVLLSQKLIDRYKTTNKMLFEQLHQWNRRVEVKIIALLR